MRKGKGRTLLQVAASRLQHMSRQQWAGFLTPRQALALHGAGVELEAGAIAHARGRKEAGHQACELDVSHAQPSATR